MKTLLRAIAVTALLLIGLESTLRWNQWQKQPPPTVRLWPNEYFHRHLLPALPLAGPFHFPLDPPDGNGAYLDRAFREDDSLGETWRPIPGVEAVAPPVPVYACADGTVLLAQNLMTTWHHVVIIAHRIPGDMSVETLYSGLSSLTVTAGQPITRGDLIGYLPEQDDAALYWEVRQPPLLGLGPGESPNPEGWLPPTHFLHSTRQSP